MDSPVQPSFIPQDAVISSRRGGSAGLPELVLLISILLLVVSAGLAGAVFLYEQYLQTATKSKIAQLNRAQSSFQPALIVQLERLDDRMTSAETLLHKHIAPSSLFKAIELSTNQNIAFNSFTFDASDPAHMSIKMTGTAASVNSVALQADLFSKSGVFTSPIFSGIDRQTDGVHFDFSALVNPTTVNFVAEAQQQSGSQTQSAAAAQPLPSQPSSPFTSPSGAATKPTTSSSTPANQ